MKKIFLALFAIALFGFVGCSDDEDDINPSSVPETVKATMQQMYPTAQWIEWNLYNDYYVADFTLSGFETDAWFLPDGVWAMTVTDYDSNVGYLPLLMQNGFDESQYASWIVDDVDLYQRTADTFAAIDVESPGQGELTIYIDDTGTIINVTPDIDTPILPTTTIDAL